MPRKAPSISATKCKVGTVKKGMDGNLWEVIKAAGTQRWVKRNNSGITEDPREAYYDGKVVVSNGSKWVAVPDGKNFEWIKYRGIPKAKIGYKSYKVLDNGGQPFRVDVSSNSIEVYILYKTHRNHGNMVLKTQYERVFIGSGPNSYKGNTVLIHVKDDLYIFVGLNIYSFRTKDRIVKYVSTIGNSDVPYPYAIGEENVYFMIEEKYLPIDKVNLDDPYESLYRPHTVYKRAPVIKLKILHDRLW